MVMEWIYIYTGLGVDSSGGGGVDIGRGCNGDRDGG